MRHQPNDRVYSSAAAAMSCSSFVSWSSSPAICSTGTKPVTGTSESSGRGGGITEEDRNVAISRLHSKSVSAGQNAINTKPRLWPQRVCCIFLAGSYLPEPLAFEISIGSSSQSNVRARAVVSIGATSGISSATDAPSSANLRAETSTRFSSDPTAWL